MKITPTTAETELIRRLQRWYNDLVKDGQPLGDWHVECPTVENAVALLRKHVRDENLRVPCPELEGTFPVVLYFGTAEDARQFETIVREAKPGMITRKL